MVAVELFGSGEGVYFVEIAVLRDFPPSHAH